MFFIMSAPTHLAISIRSVDPCMFYSLIKSNFHVSKGLLCLYDEQNNTWLLVDMKFFFSCSTQNLTRSLRLLVRYRVKHPKRNSISTRAHVLFSIYLGNHDENNVGNVVNKESTG